MFQKDKVCTVEQSAKLLELGLKTRPEQYFVMKYKTIAGSEPKNGESKPKGYQLKNKSFVFNSNRDGRIGGDISPAYDFVELMKMLPKESKVEITQHHHKGVLMCIGIGSGYWHSMGVSLIDALAKLVIILLENNHIKASDLNQ